MIEVDGNRVLDVESFPIKNDPDNDILHLSGQTYEGGVYYTLLTEEGLSEAKLSEEGTILLRDLTDKNITLCAYREVPVKFEW